MIPEATGRRALRGSGAAVVATFIALSSHIIGGGSLPTVWGLVVPLALSVLVCVLLAGRRLSLWRLTVSVALSQALFHLLFSVLTPAVPARGPSTAAQRHALHHGGAQSPPTGSALDSSASAGASASPGPNGSGLEAHAGAHAHSSLPMLLAHLVAAVLTIAFIYWAEALPAKLCEFGRRIIRALLPALLRLRTVSEGPNRSVIIARTAPPRPSIVRSPVLRRGPPVLAF